MVPDLEILVNEYVQLLPLLQAGQSGKSVELHRRPFQLYSTRWSASMGRARNSRSSGLGSLRDSCGGMLRSWGELHRWMYDRYSMTALLTHVGFHRVVIMNATESRIPGWAGFCLDTDRDGRVLHRDSLYVEAVRE